MCVLVAKNAYGTPGRTAQSAPSGLREVIWGPRSGTLGQTGTRHTRGPDAARRDTRRSADLRKGRLRGAGSGAERRAAAKRLPTAASSHWYIGPGRRRRKCVHLARLPRRSAAGAQAQKHGKRCLRARSRLGGAVRVRKVDMPPLAVRMRRVDRRPLAARMRRMDRPPLAVRTRSAAFGRREGGNWEEWCFVRGSVPSFLLACLPPG